MPIKIDETWNISSQLCADGCMQCKFRSLFVPDAGWRPRLKSLGYDSVLGYDSISAHRQFIFDSGLDHD